MKLSELIILSKAGYTKKDIEKLTKEEAETATKELESKKEEEEKAKEEEKKQASEKENKIKELEKELEELRKSNLNKDISGDDESFEDKLNDSLNALI